MMLDPDGHFVWLAINAGFAAYDGYQAYKTGKGWKFVAKKAALGAVGGGKFKLVKSGAKAFRGVLPTSGISLKAGSKTVAGKITGYTKHGLEQAMQRDGSRGVSPKAILDTVKNPTKMVQHSEGRMKYMSKSAVVVLNKAGKVITTYAKGSKGIRRK